MPHYGGYSQSEQAVLDALSEHTYLVAAQLCAFTGYRSSTVGDVLKRLVLHELVQKLDLLSPAAYCLSNKGARIQGAPMPRDRSYPAIQHIVHVNSALLQLRSTHPGARLIPRTTLYAHGLHPSVGEHAARVDGGWIFMLVDDYRMRPGRVRDSWLRTHKAVGRFVNIEALRARGEFLVSHWRDAVKYFYVFTTDARQVKRFSKTAEKNNLPAHVEQIDPVWDLAV